MRHWLRAFPFLVVAVSLAALAIAPRRATTVPLYAARQGLMCQSCHFDPNGGGPRNEFGFAFAKNRHSLEADTSGEWKDLDLTNRVGDKLPLYFGGNQRFMLISNKIGSGSGVDRAGFFSMETALHIAFQPHPRLTLVASQDGFDAGARRTKEAYGLISVTNDFYFRAGRFRVPYGLRFDDHTVATRQGFLDFESGQSFLPFDPREPDEGVEVGGTHNGWFGRASFTNGVAQPLFGPVTRAQAVAAKFGKNHTHYQGGLSFYDDWSATTGPGEQSRATRWGYYGLGHLGQFAGIWEVGAGTDRFSANPGEPDVKRNELAYIVELDYAPRREWNARLRYDHLDADRASDPTIRDFNSWNRYALEGEWVPVPFAEIRLALRLIDPVADRDPNTLLPLETEKQGFVQFHFSY